MEQHLCFDWCTQSPNLLHLSYENNSVVFEGFIRFDPLQAAVFSFFAPGLVYYDGLCCSNNLLRRQRLGGREGGLGLLGQSLQTLAAPQSRFCHQQDPLWFSTSMRHAMRRHLHRLPLIITSLIAGFKKPTPSPLSPSDTFHTQHQ